MVGHRFVAACIERGLHESHRIVVVGEERRPAYDRVHLSSLFDGATPDDLSLGDQPGVELVLGDPVSAIDTGARTATTASGRALAWDRCVLATGSYPFVPPIPGADAAGSFVYRTIDDLAAI